MMMAASAKSEQSDEKKAGKGHPASVSKEGSPHGQMPESMKEAMKKMGANMDPEKQWKWLSLWVQVRKH